VGESVSGSSIAGAEDSACVFGAPRFTRVQGLTWTRGIDNNE
jgi:hypothetical protein